MNKFIAIKLKSEWAKENILPRLIKYASKYIPFKPKRVHYYQFGDILIYSAESPSAGGFSEKNHVHVNEEGCLLFDGMPFLGEQDVTDNWAKTIDKATNHLNEDSTFELLLGNYSFMRIRNGAISAFGDFAGICPLFYMSNEDIYAVSNRQMLLAKTCMRQDNLAIDYKSLSWLPGQANIMGDVTIFHGVRLLEPGSYINIKDTCRIHTFSKQVWNGERRELSKIDFDEVFEILIAQFKAISRLPFNKLSLSLTGGMDSRLILSLALQSGLIDLVDDVFTNGREGSPEVEIAAYISNKVGVKHNARVSKPSEFDLDKTWENLKYHVFRFEGSVCPWDGIGSPASRSQLELNGMGGEVLSKHVKAHANLQLDTIEEAIMLFQNYQQKTDPLDILKGEYVEFQKQYMHDLVNQRHNSGIDLNDIGDILYIENRLTMWSGLIAANTYGKVRVFPLLNFAVARLAFQGGYVNRQMARVHFEIMKRAKRDLCELPFLGKSWDERLRPFLDGINVSAPYEPKQEAVSQNMVSWQWEFINQGWDQIKEFLLGAPNTGLFDIVDFDSLSRILDNRENIKSVIHAKELLSLIAMQILLTNQYIIHQEGKTEDIEYHSNIDQMTIHDGKPIIISQLPVVTLEIPTERIVRLRIDPIDQECKFALGKIWLVIDGVTHVISENGFDGLKPNARVKNPNKFSSFTFYECEGSDPHFSLEIPDDLLTSAKDISLYVQTLPFKRGRIMAYYDLGEGFSERLKVSKSISSA